MFHARQVRFRCTSRTGFDSTIFNNLKKEIIKYAVKNFDPDCNSEICNKMKKKSIKHAVKMLTSAVTQQFSTSGKRKESNTISDIKIITKFTLAVIQQNLTN